MKFELVSIDKASGGVLAHSHTRVNRKFRKGYKLTDDDISVFESSDLTHVYIARIEKDDIEENEAAAEVARHIAGKYCKIREAFTGRCNLYSTERGIIKIDQRQIDALNMVDPDVTIATIAPWTSVRAGQILTTIKIIPFAITNQTLAKIGELSATVPRPIEVLPFKPHRSGLITTRVANTGDKLIEKGYMAIQERMERCGSTVDQHIVCSHTEPDVSEAIKMLSGQSLSPIMILGAAAISDERDVVPAALVSTGGQIEHVGMPVDPGNLIMLGSLNGKPVIGVPSCARSPKENGFDLVLHRILAGQTIRSRDIMGMGVGGLLNDTSMRPEARTDEGQMGRVHRAAVNVGAVILGAGLSTRMGHENKLLQDLEGQAVIRRVVKQVIDSRATHIVVVLGHQAAEVRAVLDGLEVTIVENSDFESGLSSSLKQGLRALPADLDGFLVCLGDMPMVQKQHINKLIEKFKNAGSSAICIPEFHGKRGNPVLWAARYRDDIAKLSGDVGAKTLLVQFQHHIAPVGIDDDGILADIDTPGMLKEIRQKFNNRKS